MDTVFYQLLTSRQVTLVNMVIGAVAFVLLLILLFGRNSRDERGRKIIGKASIAALICFALFATLASHYMQHIAVESSSGEGSLMLDAYLAVHAVQLVFNITAAVEIAGILILKRRE